MTIEGRKTFAFSSAILWVKEVLTLSFPFLNLLHSAYYFCFMFMVTRVYSCNFPLLQGKFPFSFHLFMVSDCSIRINKDVEVVEGTVELAFYETEPKQ